MVYIFYLMLFFLSALVTAALLKLEAEITADYPPVSYKISLKYLFFSFYYYSDGRMLLRVFKWEKILSDEENKTEMDLQYFAKSRSFRLFNRYRYPSALLIRMILIIFRQLHKTGTMRSDLHIKYCLHNWETAGKIYAFLICLSGYFRKFRIMPVITYTSDESVLLKSISVITIRPVSLLYVFPGILFFKDTWRSIYWGINEYLRLRRIKKKKQACSRNGEWSE